MCLDSWPEGTYNKSKQMLRWGIYITIGSAIIWGVYESICKMENAYWLGYIPGHGVWHIGISYGLSSIAIWIVQIDSYLWNEYFAYKTLDERIIKFPCRSCDKCNNCLQRWFPIITHQKYVKEDNGEEDNCDEHKKVEIGLQIKQPDLLKKVSSILATNTDYDELDENDEEIDKIIALDIDIGQTLQESKSTPL